MAADGGVGDEKLRGRLREAFQPGGGLEGLKGIQRWQTASQELTCEFLLQVA